MDLLVWIILFCLLSVLSVWWPRRRFYWRLSNGGRAFYGISAGQPHGGFPRVQNVAMADLILGLHRRMELTATLRPIALIMGGVLTIIIADSTLH